MEAQYLTSETQYSLKICLYNKKGVQWTPCSQAFRFVFVLYQVILLIWLISSSKLIADTRHRYDVAGILLIRL